MTDKTVPKFKKVKHLLNTLYIFAFLTIVSDTVSKSLHSSTLPIKLVKWLTHFEICISHT